ncbi:hypothetical protein KR222_009876 [Zaprionus bogoriensis]|nr:hypothetical protein KR222_009876 [Zaprionus bogoriensis]
MPEQTDSNLTPSVTNEIKSPCYDLSKFRLSRILNNNSRSKSITLLGTFPNLSEKDAAIVVFEKNAYRESDVATEAPTEGSAGSEAKPSYFSSELKVRTDFVNNIYASFQCVPSQELCGMCITCAFFPHANGNVFFFHEMKAVKSTVIYPATEKHIEKYSICQKYLINETPDLYETVTLPYINSSQFSLDWVYNIIDHKQEADRIVFEDKDAETGFILLPDLKWDGRNEENLYLLGIVRQRDIKSLRDLNASHLPLLRNLRQSAKQAIQKRYGLNPTQLRMYFHYQPSFYHLHVHINLIRNDAPGIWCEKAHMLDTVINNLELVSDYYQRAHLPFVLYEGNKLLDLYDEKLKVRNKTLKEESEDQGVTAKDGSTDAEPDDSPQHKRIKLSAEVESDKGELASTPLV